MSNSRVIAYIISGKLTERCILHDSRVLDKQDVEKKAGLLKKYFKGLIAVCVIASAALGSVAALDYAVISNCTYKFASKEQMEAFIQFKEQSRQAVTFKDEKELYIETVTKMLYLYSDLKTNLPQKKTEASYSDGDMYLTFVASANKELPVQRHCFNSLEEMNDYVAESCVDFAQISDIPGDFFESKATVSDEKMKVSYKNPILADNFLLLSAAALAGSILLYSLAFDIIKKLIKY